MHVGIQLNYDDVPRANGEDVQRRVDPKRKRNSSSPTKLTSFILQAYIREGSQLWREKERMTTLKFSLSAESTGRIHDLLVCLSKFGESVSLEAKGDQQVHENL